MNTFWFQHQASLIVFIGVLLLIAISNALTLRRLGTYAPPAHWPRVSVLVPARNEEHNIGSCARSLLAQDYPDFQVLILDDDSTDGTAHVLVELAKEDSRLHVLRGEPLPPGWLGKHWACHQLAQAADGDLLLFTDADTSHHPDTLRVAVAALLGEQADLLTAFVREEVVSWAEKLIVPALSWSLFSFLPFALAHRLRWPALSATNGQFMLFRRQAYMDVGGHARVRMHVVDDFALGRNIIAHGGRWRMVDALAHVRCRMYHNFGRIFEGLSKNLFPAFGYNVPVFLFVWLWIGTVFWEPLIVMLLSMLGAPISDMSQRLAGVAVGCSLLLWGLSHWRLRFPVYLTFLYPLSVLLMVVIALCSMVLTLLGKTTWKGRKLARRP